MYIYICLYCLSPRVHQLNQPKTKQPGHVTNRTTTHASGAPVPSPTPRPAHVHAQPPRPSPRTKPMDRTEPLGSTPPMRIASVGGWEKKGLLVLRLPSHSSITKQTARMDAPNEIKNYSMWRINQSPDRTVHTLLQARNQAWQIGTNATAHKQSITHPFSL
jgi:hypothetical protein